MENYIIKILENNNRVIVPEFGAFIVKQRNPLIIVFNEFLQYNDGMLVDFISKSEDLSRDDAKAKIDAFVAEVTKSIEKDNSFSMSKLGLIKKSSTGKISIEQETAATKSAKKESKPASKTLLKTEKVKDQKTSAMASDDRKDTPKEEKTIPEEVVPSDATAESTDQETIKKNPTLEPEKEKTPEKSPESQEKPSESATVTKDTDQNVPDTTEPKKAPEKPVEKPSPVKKAEPGTQLKPTTAPGYIPQKGKRTNIIWWIIIIVLVNAIIISIFIFKGDIGSVLHSKGDAETIDYLENEILLPEEPSEDASLEETVQSEEVIPESATEVTTPAATPPPKTITGIRYYIIAGAFQNEENANNLVIELKARGFNSEKIGKNGNLHLVSYDVFQTKADADRSLRKIKKEVDPEAWIRTVK